MQTQLWQATDVVAQPVGDELLLLQQSDGRLHHLNTTAAWVYAHCDGRSSPALAAALAAHFDVAPDVARRDVEAVTAQLITLGVLRAESSSAAAQ